LGGGEKEIRGILFVVCGVASREKAFIFCTRGARDEREDPRRVYYHAPPRFCTVEKRHQSTHLKESL
jgi:hypothetical protein